LFLHKSNTDFTMFLHIFYTQFNLPSKLSLQLHLVLYQQLCLLLRLPP
jgi:hypothetical protein